MSRSYHKLASSLTPQAWNGSVATIHISTPHRSSCRGAWQGRTSLTWKLAASFVATLNYCPCFSLLYLVWSAGFCTQVSVWCVGWRVCKGQDSQCQDGKSGAQPYKTSGLTRSGTALILGFFKVMCPEQPLCTVQETKLLYTEQWVNS